MTEITTRDHLMMAAERLMRTRGYSAISYADLSEAVGIRKASIHHHFPSKADLGAALAADYVARFQVLLEGIEREEKNALARIRRYASIYETSVRDGMLCLCGMLVTEIHVLPEPVRTGVRRFFTQQLAWLARVLSEGAAKNELKLVGGAEAAAERTLSVLEGSTLTAWGLGDPAVVARATADLIETLKG